MKGKNMDISVSILDLKEDRFLKDIYNFILFM